MEPRNDFTWEIQLIAHGITRVDFLCYDSICQQLHLPQILGSPGTAEEDQHSFAHSWASFFFMLDCSNMAKAHIFQKVSLPLHMFKCVRGVNHCHDNHRMGASSSEEAFVNTNLFNRIRNTQASDNAPWWGATKPYGTKRPHQTHPNQNTNSEKILQVPF